VEYAGGAAEEWLLIGADGVGDELCTLMLLKNVFSLVYFKNI
jgi:hypothetical protein